MTQHPSSALDRAAVDAVAAHGVNGGHAQQTTARRIGWQVYLAKLVTGNAVDSVVGGEQSVDEDIVALQKIAESTTF